MMISEALQHALWCAANWNDLQGEYPECDKCPYRPADQAYCNEMDAIIVDAYKALTPRLIDLSEMRDYIGQPVWVENIGYDVEVAIVDSYSKRDGAIWMTRRGPRGEVEDASYYGRLWRCWTLRPTEAQREAAKWR